MPEQSIVGMFARQAEKLGKRTALLVKREGKYKEISWIDFLNQVKWFALGLNSLGVKKEDKVCLLAENRPEWAFCDLAILSLGAANVPIYPTSSALEIEFIVNHSEAQILIVSTPEQYSKIGQIRKNCPRLGKVIALDPLTDSDLFVSSFASISEMGKREDVKQPALYDSLYHEVKPGDLASIIYTSGTTGEPKGAMLTHRNFMSNVEAAAKVLPAGEEDRSLSFLPLSHVFERMAGYYFLIHQGASIAYAENVNTVPENLLEVHPTIVASVPRLYEKMYARMLDQVQSGDFLKKKLFLWSLNVGRASSSYRIAKTKMPLFLRVQYQIAKRLVFQKIKARLGGKLRFFISGGAPLSKEIAEFFFSADVLILEGYGLTETSPVVSVNAPEAFKFGTVGRPVSEVEVKIASDGEILVRGPNVMLGYFKNEEGTREAIKDGWFYTGDIGEFDSDGFLKITDRKKDLIVTSGGKNIAPQKIENLLVADKYIAQICICGDRKNYLTALIVPDFAQIEKYARYKGISYQNPQNLTANNLIQDLIRRRIEGRSATLANYERVKYFTLLPEEFTQEKGELTPTLKLKRKVINQRYRSQIETMYGEKAS